jgi:hypothetical protein
MKNGFKIIFLTVIFCGFFGLAKSSQAALIDTMKTNGCVFEALLSGQSGDTDNSIAMLERSQCRYLHRAVETWITPPDFTVIQGNMAKITVGNYIYGMFLAEAISTTPTYYYPAESRNFDFSAMCESGTTGYWGANTCIPFLQNGSDEYKKYLIYVMEKAIDLGIQDFTFGQIYMTDNRQDGALDSVLTDVRQYATAHGKTIVIGAQTNDITDESYLRKFDYIENGIGEDAEGNIESGACSTAHSSPGFCWALLWNSAYAPKANNVLLALDWASDNNDDMTIFSRMNHGARATFLQNMYHFFQNQNIGFLMPEVANIYYQGGGCYGAVSWYYSADNLYSCKDENQISGILSGMDIIPPAAPSGLSVS